MARTRLKKWNKRIRMISYRWYNSTSYCVTNVTAFPERPARAVRPTRWM